MITLADTVLDSRFVKLSSKAAPLLMPLFLRGAAMGASRLGNDRMMLEYGKRLADKGIDPSDIHGKKQTTWIDPTMMYGMSLGLGAHLASQYFNPPKDPKADTNMMPLYLGTALGGSIGAYKTYKEQANIARDLLKGKKTRDTDLVQTRDYIRDKLKELDKKKK